jgi:hypothetical protein
VTDLLAQMPFAAAWRALDLDRLVADDVDGRLAMYRRLVERDGAMSPFWGYAAQLAWQHASGRLGGAGTRIARDSWWGACNFALSVVPYAVAAEAGLVPRIAVDVGAYAAALPHWRAALRVGLDGEPLRFAMWRAHLASIEIAVRTHVAELALLPAAERAFARGWVRMVDLFGAAALRTDLAYLVERGTGALPGRMLREHDDFGDLPRAERSAARRVIALGARPAWRWPLELAVWRRMMRTREAREDLDGVFAGLFGRDWRKRLRAVAYAVRP